MAIECPRPDGREKARSHNDEWLATLSHELRSPLATVLSALEVISADHDIYAGNRRARDIANRQARKALQLVEDLFAICASSRGKLSIRKELVDFADIVTRATETAAHLLAAKGHRLTVSLPPGPLTLHADSLRLEQVLTNLLANAAKFTEPGGHIRLSVKREMDGRQIAVRIADNGRGIAQDVLPQIFELFHQGLDGVQQGGGGLGIGLALVKSLVELHGGTVTAFSDGLGQGAEFVVRLPISAWDS